MTNVVIRTEEMSCTDAAHFRHDAAQRAKLTEQQQPDVFTLVAAQKQRLREWVAGVSA